MDEYEVWDAINDRQTQTFIRLHALIAKGYVPQFGSGTYDQCVSLNSPSPQSPALTMYPDGMIAATFYPINNRDKDDPNRILNMEARTR